MPKLKNNEIDFVNREKEKEYLKKYFSNLPNAILFLYGPKSCGKSTLIHKIIKDLDQKKYAINFIDLRQVIINDAKSFLDIFFQRDIKTKTKDILSGTTFNIGFFKVNISDEEIFKKNAFKIIIDQIKKAREKNIQPIIFIDEIQGLKDIYLNGGKKLLDELFNLFIALTKVEHLAHIVLATSDSCFIEEIHNHAKLPKTAELLLIDHLNFKDVEDWLGDPKYNLGKKDIDYVYKNLGGSPWEIQQVITKVRDGDDLREVMEKYMKFLYGRAFLFYEDRLEGDDKKQFAKVSREIGRKGFYRRKKDDNLRKLLEVAVEKDFWFYNPDEQKITANSPSLGVVFRKLF